MRYEDAAEIKTVSGWCCKVCGRFWGEAADGEHMARYCCCTSRPCKDCGCATGKNWTRCRDCSAAKDLARYVAAPRVEWDGEFPLSVYRGDKYFFDAESLADFMEDHKLRLDGIALETCKKQTPRTFEMADFLSDDLPEDGGELYGAEEIDAVVNKWIQEWFAAAPVYNGTGKVPSLASLRANLPHLANV